MASLSDDRVREFLTHGTRTGKLAFVAPNGRPVVAPIWFVVEDEESVFNTRARTAKGKAFAHDRRVAVCVDLEPPPYGVVQIQGTVTTSEDSGALLRTATAIGARYMGADRAGEFGRRNGVPGVLVVRLRPVKVFAAFDVTA